MGWKTAQTDCLNPHECRAAIPVRCWILTAKSGAGNNQNSFSFLTALTGCYPMNTTPTSPFAAPFADLKDRVPAVFERQFLYHAGVKDKPEITGTMHKVWIKPWLRPFFAIIGRLGILLPRGGVNVPTQLDIQLGEDARGFPVQAWNRSLAFRKPAAFNTRMAWIPEMNAPVELVGPGLLVGMLWSTEFEPPHHLQLDSCGWVLRLGTRYLRIPDFLTPWTFGRVEFAQDADPDDPNCFYIDLKIIHWPLGTIFSYTGTFYLN